MEKMTFSQRVEAGLVLFDGAMGTMLHAADIREEDWLGNAGCSEILLDSRPEVIRGIHEAYYRAGSDVVTTNSFGSNRIVLAEYGLSDQARRLSRKAAEVACQAAALWSDPSVCPAGPEAAKSRYVAGSMGPGTRLVSLGQTDWDTMLASYMDQALGLLEGGVDLFLIETCQDPLQIKCALCACQDAMKELGRRIPAIVTVTVETTGTLLVGSDIQAVMTALEPFEILALGMNCATGPADMRPYLHQISQTWKGRVLIQPNAGLPQNVNGELKYTLAVEEYVRHMKAFITEEGITLAGGCCGTNPDYIGALARVLPGLVPSSRSPDMPSRVASLFSVQDLTQDPPGFYIGERTNTNGSKLFRETLLKDDWDGLVEVAREQTITGVHALDVCVAYTGRDEIRDMKETLRRMVTQVDMPLVIDSTEVPVLEQALKMYGGRAIINSINLEDGEDRARRIIALARRYGAALIALTIDEDGMAREPAKKLAIARRIHRLAVDEGGLKSQDLLFDALTFTLGSGDETLRDSALATMEGIRLIKQELPGVRTVLGLSNVSFGLSPKSRKVLNSVFLSRCLASGLDGAIINLAHIVPVASIPAEDLEAARKLIDNDRSAGDPLFDFIKHFEGRTDTSEAEAVSEADLPVTELLARNIIKGSRKDLAERLEKARSEGHAPLEIINDILIPAMKVVGELFGSGKMQLPFVLQSAEVMKSAVDHLEPFMERKEGEEQVAIVLATVRGDVHDIGKNLVDIILTNNGYKVHNLGIKCEVETMIQKARETGARAIGMSGLLVKSTIIMKENIEEIARRELNLPVLLGGAALTPSYVDEVCQAASASPVMYCADAFEGLKAMNLIKEGRLEEYLAAERSRRNARRPLVRTAPVREKVAIDREVDVPAAPFLGWRTAKGIALDSVFSFLTEEVLFRGRWGYRRGTMGKDEYDDFIAATVRPEFEALKTRVRRNGFILPSVSYGYWECNSRGDDVILYHPGTADELSRFTFPRQKEEGGLCIADYFLPEGSGRRDLIALQVATVGPNADTEAHRLYQSGNYRDYLLFHGLAVECAEALAEYWHLHIRQELGITGEDGSGISDFVVQKYRGSRYSFGYPACPDLAQNRILCDLVHAEEIGVRSGEEFQMVPEQTTSAFIVHHPQAKYFNA